MILADNPVYVRLRQDSGFPTLLAKRLDESQQSFRKYIAACFDSDGTYNIVDIGWTGSMQEAIHQISGLPLNGYYLGINNGHLDMSCRKGLIFESVPHLCRYTRHSQILKANIQLYEQLAAAPHGSAVGYAFDGDGNVIVNEDWVENERHLYDRTICHKQDTLLLLAQALSVWCNDLPDKPLLDCCAKIVLRSALLADDNRLGFLDSLDKGFVWNFNAQHKGLRWDANSIHIGSDLILHPDRYTRYLAKLQRHLRHKPRILQRLYPLFAHILIPYIYLMSRFDKTTVKQSTAARTLPLVSEG